jgi:hypothetical protein
MKRSLPKKPARKSAKKAVPAGRILEMRPVPPKKPFAPGVFLLALVAVASLAACAFALEKLGAALAYAEEARMTVAKTSEENAELKGRMTDLKTIEELSKKSAPPAIPSGLTWKEYSSKNLTLMYPETFEVVKATASFPALSIKSDKGRVEIFRMNDFGGSRKVGTGDEGLPKEAMIAGVPLEQSAIQPYDVWIYHAPGDEQSKAVFSAIANSIKAVK